MVIAKKDAPIELYSEVIMAATQEQQWVLDICCGTGKYPFWFYCVWGYRWQSCKIPLKSIVNWFCVHGYFPVQDKKACVIIPSIMRVCCLYIDTSKTWYYWVGGGFVNSPGSGKIRTGEYMYLFFLFYIHIDLIRYWPFPGDAGGKQWFYTVIIYCFQLMQVANSYFSSVIVSEVKSLCHQHRLEMVNYE